MPYLGNPAVDRFTATKAASVYSGNGSTTAFTLEHSVGADEDILVSVDGVIQEPSVAYAVSSGTTLTFTAAPSSNSGNNIFVYYLFRTIGTVTHPSTSALSATSGTFTDDIIIGDGKTIGSASDVDAMTISSGGVVTFSQIPVFSAGGVGLTRATEVDTTSGVVIDFTGIPAGTKFIKLIGAGISHNAASTGVPSSYNMVQIGDSGGFETSGYTGSFFEQNSNGSDGSCRDMTNSSTGTNGASWAVTKATSASSLMNITVDMRLIDEDTFTWAYSFVSSFNGTGVSLGAGAKTLSAELTQVRFGTVGGNNTFDAGKMTIQFE